ncbi:MAG: hypothetical protein U1F58_05700 [Burkholderiales bacterium]
MATPARQVLKLQLRELGQMFNGIDPAPFRERDLDPAAEAYIVDWCREAQPDAPLVLEVRLTASAPGEADAAMLRDAVHEYFRNRARVTRRQLARLFRTGRVSLVIGLGFLAAAFAVGEALAGVLSHAGYGTVVRESLVIGAWVALWRPLEIFLYDWWPIRAEARMYDRLGDMPVALAGGAPV